jgi:hypothetical protein
LYDQRNGVPLSSLGDKIYKCPEYQTDFFKDGGLITGSTYISFLPITLKLGWPRKREQATMLRE